MDHRLPERPATCPPWCDLDHGAHLGEDDEVHIGGHRCVRNLLIRLCATVDGATGAQEGPFVLLDAHELTLPEVDNLVATLSQLRDQARGINRVNRPAGA